MISPMWTTPVLVEQQRVTPRDSVVAVVTLLALIGVIAFVGVAA